MSSIEIGHGPQLLLRYGNRHGLIAGATGTGKTVTLQTLAEGFSRAGVPVFMADVKGDLAGLAKEGGDNPRLVGRATELGYTLEPEGFPVVFWDLFGEQGHPIRTTVSEMGPLLLARLLNLNDAQEGVLNLTFKLADDEGLLLLDFKDLRSMLAFVGENAKELRNTYGNVSSATVGAIQRSLLVLEQQGGEAFFGEPALDLNDFMRTGAGAKGNINILAADKLMQSPRLYATFLLWLLSELFEDLPEAGDLPQPKLVFFFDEAHLLFNDAPKALVEKIEQVVRLIRSKGVGVYFITQSPTDVPDTVLAQLGNRVQHALRAFTPRDQKAVKTAADTFRPNPAFSSGEAITQLGVGEALVSFLDEKGTPTVVERLLIKPPCSRVGPVTPVERLALMSSSPVVGIYDQAIDTDSAFEHLNARAAKAAQEAEAMAQAEAEADAQEEAREQAAKAEAARVKAEQQALREADRARRAYEKTAQRTYRAPAYRSSGRSSSGGSRRSDTVVESMTKSVVRSAGSQLGRTLVRGILGGLFKGR